jgi:hypothetical protein
MNAQVQQQAHEAFLIRNGFTAETWKQHCEAMQDNTPYVQVDPIERDLNDKTWDDRDIDAQEEYETERGN